MALYFIYSYSGLILQTCSTNLQPSPNLLNNPAPSKWLAPAPPKSYQMFYQNVTHSNVNSCKVGMRIGNLNDLPLIIQHLEIGGYSPVHGAAVPIAKIANFAK